MTSITSILKVNIKQILRNSPQGLTITEIKEALEKRGITDYRQGHLAGSLKQILDDPGYCSPQRGVYQCVKSEEDLDTRQLVSAALKIRKLYQDTIEKSTKLLNEIDIVNSSEEEVKQVINLRNLIVETKKLVQSI